MTDKQSPSTDKTNKAIETGVVGEQLNSDNAYSENGLENEETLRETMKK
jgi:hypothetical protein